MKQIIRIIPTAAAAICMTCVSAFAAGEDNPGRWLYDSLPPAWEWTPETTQISPDKDIWWHQFGDETLITLLRRAVEHNYNARTALRRHRPRCPAGPTPRHHRRPGTDRISGRPCRSGKEGLPSHPRHQRQHCH